MRAEAPNGGIATKDDYETVERAAFVYDALYAVSEKAKPAIVQVVE